MSATRIERPCNCQTCRDLWWVGKRLELADNYLTGVGEQPDLDIGVEEIAQEREQGAPCAAANIAVARLRDVSTDLMESEYKRWLLSEIAECVDGLREKFEAKKFGRAY